MSSRQIDQLQGKEMFNRPNLKCDGEILETTGASRDNRRTLGRWLAGSGMAVATWGIGVGAIPLWAQPQPPTPVAIPVQPGTTPVAPAAANGSQPPVDPNVAQPPATPIGISPPAPPTQGMPVNSSINNLLGAKDWEEHIEIAYPRSIPAAELAKVLDGIIGPLGTHGTQATFVSVPTTGQLIIKVSGPTEPARAQVSHILKTIEQIEVSHQKQLDHLKLQKAAGSEIDAAFSGELNGPKWDLAQEQMKAQIAQLAGEKHQLEMEHQLLAAELKKLHADAAAAQSSRVAKDVISKKLNHIAQKIAQLPSPEHRARVKSQIDRIHHLRQRLDEAEHILLESLGESAIELKNDPHSATKPTQEREKKNSKAPDRKPEWGWQEAPTDEWSLTQDEWQQALQQFERSLATSADAAPAVRERRLEMSRRMLELQRRRLETRLDMARRLLETAMHRRERSHQLVESGALPQTAVLDLDEAVVRAEADLKELEIVLEMFHAQAETLEEQARKLINDGPNDKHSNSDKADTKRDEHHEVADGKPDHDLIAAADAADEKANRLIHEHEAEFEAVAEDAAEFAGDSSDEVPQEFETVNDDDADDEFEVDEDEDQDEEEAEEDEDEEDSDEGAEDNSAEEDEDDAEEEDDDDDEEADNEESDEEESTKKDDAPQPESNSGKASE